MVPEYETRSENELVLLQHATDQTVQGILEQLRRCNSVEIFLETLIDELLILKESGLAVDHMSTIAASVAQKLDVLDIMSEKIDSTDTLQIQLSKRLPSILVKLHEEELE